MPVRVLTGIFTFFLKLTAYDLKLTARTSNPKSFAAKAAPTWIILT